MNECESLFKRWVELAETVRTTGSIVQNECTAIPANLPEFGKQCVSLQLRLDTLIKDTVHFCGEQ